MRWVSVTVLSLPLVAVSRGYYPVAVCGLLTAAASLVAEHGFLGHAGFGSCSSRGSRVQAQSLWHMGLVAPQHV